MKDIKKYFSSPTKTKAIQEHSIKTTETISSIEQNTDKDLNKRKQKKKKKRKHSDPAVRDVTYLLSNNLKLVSPGTTPETKNIKISADSDNVLHSTIINENIKSNKNDSELVSPCNTPDTKNHNILENGLDDLSTGRVNNENNESIKKNAFQFMMERRNRSIGLNSPGKELEKESSTISNNDSKEVLSVRRQVLANWSEQKGATKRKRLEEEKDQIIDHKLKKRAKRFKKLLNIETTEEECSNKRTRKHRIKKLSTSSEDSEFEQCKNVKENSKIIKKRDKGEKNKPNKELNQLEEAQVSSNEKPVKTKNSNILDFIKSEKTNNSFKTNNKLDVNKKKSSKDIKIIATEYNENVKDETNTPKGKKNRKKRKTTKIDETLDEGSQESIDFTPTTLRSWKMRIKIKMDENNLTTEIESSENKINCTEENDLSDDIQKESSLIQINSESEDEKQTTNSLKKDVKIAPIFMKAVPKPKEDPTVVEARKQFLMSGIPSSLKKTIEKQNSIIEQYDIFPTTSHVQQKSDSFLWNLPEPELKLYKFSPLKTSLINRKCQKITNSHKIRTLNIDTEVKKVDKLKILLNKIKSENPNYPVYKSFRKIYDKSGQNMVKKETKMPEKRKRGRKKKKDVPEITPVQKPEPDSVEHAMWTEKYKPKCSEDIIGNSQAIKNLKKWLDNWKNFSQEINSKKCRISRSSESEFETTDGDSKDSTKLPGKIIVLGGPCGSGKSTAVYAICNELGFNVIELNASSKRTGKRLLQEIQEATQSHQVRNNDQNFFNNSQKKNENTDYQTDKKMCVILVEDVDIVFEQDDGFITALIQLTTTSKRPIIATTSNYDSIFVQKFLNQFEYIPFLPLSSFSLSTWLQIVCLCEGLFVSQDEIGSLLEYNKGDARKTLLEFQFWVQSGGQMDQNVTPIKIQFNHSCEEHSEINELFVDDASEECEIIEHKNCIKSFEVLEMEEPFKIPFYLNLGLLWWNIPSILNVTNYSKQRIDKIQDKNAEIKTKQNSKQILLVSKLYDSLAYTDVAYKITKYFDGNEPLVRHSIDFRDSLELCETFENETSDMEFVHEINHTIVNGYVKKCTKIFGESNLDITKPDKSERRWRARLQECENVYQNALSLTTEKKSTALDYMPILRDITRSECSRATKNTKRGNRFRNYLRDLSVHSNEKMINIASNALNNCV